MKTPLRSIQTWLPAAIILQSAVLHTGAWASDIVVGNQSSFTLAANDVTTPGLLTIDHQGFLQVLVIPTQPGPVTAFGRNIVINSSGFASSSTAVYLAASGATSSHQMIFPSLSVNGPAGIAVAPVPGTTPDIAWTIQSVQLNGALGIFGAATGGNGILGNINYNGTVTLGSLQESSPSSLSVGANQTVHITGTGAYSGGTNNANGILFADAAHALGTGTVNMTSGSLTLNATDAAGGNITGGNVFYNANGAVGGHTVTGSFVFVGNTITSLSDGSATDQFSNIPALQGNSAGLAAFDRGIGGGTVNISFAPGAVIENTDGTVPTVQHLGANADLVLGLGSPSALSTTLGLGTPWHGVSASAYRGTITALSDILLNGVYVGGTDSSFQILNAPGGSPVNVTLQGTLALSSANLTGVSSFSATATSTLTADNALGGGAGSSAVPMDVSSNVNLTVASSAAINAPTMFHGGSTLTIQSAGLSGSGVLSRDAASMSFGLANPNALSGPQLAGLIHPGDSVILEASDIQNLNTLDSTTTFLLTDGTITQSGTLSINGGGIAIGAPSPLQSGTFAAGILSPSSGQSLLVAIGSQGATFKSALANTLDITAPIHATGDINIASSSLGDILLDNSANQFLGSVNLNGGLLGIASPACIVNATVNLTGGTLALAASSSSTPLQYNNPINVLSDASLATPTSLSAFLGTGSASTGAASITLNNVTIGNAAISLQSITAQLTLSSIMLTGNATVDTSPVALDFFLLGNIAQAGTSPQSLTLGTIQGVASRNLVLNGTASNTGPITIGPQTTVAIDGAVAPASEPLSVGSHATLAGNGIIHRNVLMGPASTIAPGALTDPIFGNTSPGTLEVGGLTLAADSVLNFDLSQAGIIGGGANDLIKVDDDLTLAGSLTVKEGPQFSPGRYVLLTYGGSLTNEGLTLIPPSGFQFALDLSTPDQVGLNVTAVPEPASLLLGTVGASALLLKRRRRRR